MRCRPAIPMGIYSEVRYSKIVGLETRVTVLHCRLPANLRNSGVQLFFYMDGWLMLLANPETPFGVRRSAISIRPIEA